MNDLRTATRSWIASVGRVVRQPVLRRVLPGMLVGKILHSPYPHARIKKIDTTRAEQLEGVVAVAIGQDAPKTYGILPVGHDEYPLALDKVRYVGDNVACVVALSESVAEKALELIDVDYEVLPAYFDPQ